MGGARADGRRSPAATAPSAVTVEAAASAAAPPPTAAAAAAGDRGAAGLRRRMPLRRVRGGGGARIPAPGATPAGRAMRYYRLWVYACCAALSAAAAGFGAAAAATVVLDFRRAFVPALALHQPSFLYGALALLAQLAALPALGCYAAARLRPRLLNAFWLLLLVLLFGDVVIGAFWAYRFERVCQELRPALRARFHREYGADAEMTRLWDRLQSEEACCGATGPSEFPSNGSGAYSPSDLPTSCCAELAVPAVNGSAPRCARPHLAGCDERLLAYLRQTASLLAILGYCVLAFLKVCFLGILRYEIREMIQKIRLLRAELETPNANGAVPGSALRTPGTDITCAESERESLLAAPPPLSSPPAQQPTAKNPNGNNNYELREYRRCGAAGRRDDI